MNAERTLAGLRHRLRNDAGGALVEFVGVSVLLLVPVVYAVIAVGQIQAALFAVEGASREAARGAVVTGLDVLDRGGTMADAQVAAVTRAQLAVELALEDFGVDGQASIDFDCDADPCFQPGSNISAHVAVDVPLPGVPAVIVKRLPVSVNVSATGRSPVDGVGL